VIDLTESGPIPVFVSVAWPLEVVKTAVEGKLWIFSPPEAITPIASKVLKGTASKESEDSWPRRPTTTSVEFLLPAAEGEN
jgi:hypothetical protein